MPEIRKALAVHHTETTGDAWDGPANKARLKLDQAESYYRKAFAWQDPDLDPTNKGSFKFIHHQVDADGNIGAANTRACTSGIGVLNGGRGGTTIPDADKQGVWEHLAAHLRDADIEPPNLRTLDLEIDLRHPFGDLECRTIPGSVELREAAGDELPAITGIAAPFNKLSEPIFWFREQFRPGAFSKTIREFDQRAYWSHDSGKPLGKRSAGTLQLEETEDGLRYEIKPPNNTWGRDAVESIRRGDTSGASFAFRAISEQWEDYDDPEDRDVRELRTVIEAQLFEVSPTNMPAYPDSSAMVRARFPRIATDADALTSLIFKVRRGLELTEQEAGLASRYLLPLRRYLPAEPITPETAPGPASSDSHPDGDRPASPESHPQQEWSLTLRQRQLRIKELETSLTI